MSYYVRGVAGFVAALYYAARLWVSRRWEPTGRSMMLANCADWIHSMGGGYYQYPPHLVTTGKAPPPPYQSAPIHIAYTDRRGKEWRTLARIISVTRADWRWRLAGVTLWRRRVYGLEVVFREEIGSKNVPLNGFDAVAGYSEVWLPYHAGRNPLDEFHVGMARARAAYLWG